MKTKQLAPIVIMLLSVTDESQAFCFSEAAQRYGINEKILIAIAKVESNFNPSAININKNGSVDHGLMQINSQHLKKLAALGINEKNLMDPCTNVHVGAWILAEVMQRHGNKWWAVGAYGAGGRASKENLREQYAAKVFRALKTIDRKPATAKMIALEKASVGMQVVD